MDFSRDRMDLSYPAGWPAARCPSLQKPPAFSQGHGLSAPTAGTRHVQRGCPGSGGGGEAQEEKGQAGLALLRGISVHSTAAVPDCR